ncbi:olfactory receptor 2D3-like [Tiliqua scincoides]|uniref:olfactory receptor 2D3-like n=1 Tax=Tiliqua scincoides TaxID=71010 RepID=UPI003461B6DE
MGAENKTSATEFILAGLSSHRRTQLLLFLVIFLIYILTLVRNLVIITLVRLDPRLHTPMYFFLTHLSILEICYTTSTVPQMLAHLFSGKGAISLARCAIQMYTTMTLGGTECFLLAVMAYDRYLAICHPLLYAVTMGRARRWLLAMGSWAICCLIAALNIGCTFHHPYCGPNHVNHFFCELPLVLKLACADTRVTEVIVFWTSVLVLLAPLSVVLTSYGLILSSVLQMGSGATWRKAFSTCASHLAVVTLFYGTLIFMYLKPQSGTAPDSGKQIAVFYIVVTPLLNPIIYTLRNKEVHGSVTKVLKKLGTGQNR